MMLNNAVHSDRIHAKKKKEKEKIAKKRPKKMY